MLKIYLLRHGKAVKYENSANDFNRSLSPEGRQQIHQIGNLLKNNTSHIQEIISSGAVRTRETTTIINTYLDIKAVQYDDALFLAPVDIVIHKISKLAQKKSILYVGHNFGISEAVGYLTGESTVLSTGTCIEIELEIDDWAALSRETGRIKRTFTPDLIAF